MNAEPALTIVDMEARLAADASGQLKASLQESLQTELASLKRRMAAGLAPDEFSVANRLKEGLEAADSVVTSVWSRHHP